jgi:hypothetical protein
MTTARIDRFEADLVTIDHAHSEAVQLRARFPDSSAAHSAGLNAFIDQWPAIDADMTSMLHTMKNNIGHYDGVAALPPFVLFPWFFVIPGVLAAAAALAWGVAPRPSGAHGHRVVYRVRPYDTLWTIAARHYAGDPRDAIWRIQRANRLRGAAISPGERLVLP